MDIVGFEFTKISAEKEKELKTNHSINTNIEFTDIQKEVIKALNGLDVVKTSYKFVITYMNNEEKKDEKKEAKESKENKEKAHKAAEIAFEGSILIATSEEEQKNIFKSWKKKEIPDNIRMPIFNVLLRRCSLRALQLEEEINLPPHFPLPQVRPEQNKQE